MKTGKDTARFQYVARESQMTGSHAEFPARRLYQGEPPVAATATVTIAGNVGIDRTIIIIDTAGTSVTYTAKATEDKAENEFETPTGGSAAIAASLKDCINNAAGHNGTIVVTNDGDVLTLTQAVVGVAGNTTITSTLANTTIVQWSGGQDGRNQKYNPHSKEYVIGEGSGSFTAQIDPYRQGVSVLTDTQRAMCALPTFDPHNAGVDQEYIFGMTRLSDFSWPFVDKPNMENIGASEGLFAFAAGSIPTSSFVPLEYTIIQADKRYHLSDLFDGVAEAFPRILKGFLPKVFSRSLNPLGDDATPGIKAHIMQGNEAYKKGTSLIKPLIPMQVFGTSPFVDRGGKAAISPSGNGAGLTGIIAGSGSGSMPALVTTPDRRHGLGKILTFEAVYGPEPFDEASFDSRMFTKAQINSLNLDDDFKFTLLSNISGSTENMIPEGFKSARTGFIFTNNGLNVDSIAFGGLRRDA